jgi:hypothetical protein
MPATTLTSQAPSPFVADQPRGRERAARTGPTPFRALLAFTFIMLLAPQQSFFPPLAVVRPAFTFAGLAIATYVLDRWLRREPILVGSREVWLAFALLWWAVLTIPLGLWPGGSVGLMRDLYVKALIVFALLAHIVTTPARLTAVAWWLSAMAVPLALTGAKNYATGEFVRNTTAQRITGYEGALTANPNDLALMLNLILPLTIGLLASTRHPGLRTVLGGVVLAEIMGVIVTFSRSGFLTLALIGVLSLGRLIRSGYAPQALLIGLLALGAVPLLPGGYLDRLSTITSPSQDETGSAQERWSDMKAAAAWIADHPVVGAGLGNNVLALNEMRGPTWTAVHDVYLQYGVDLGLPGLALFLLLLSGTIRRAGEAAAAAAERGRQRLAELAGGIRLSLIAFAAAAVFHPAGYHFYFFYMAGLAVAAWRISQAVAPPLEAR